MKLKYLYLLFIIMIVGCQSESSKKLNDDQIRELAWNSLNESEKNQIVGSKEDILYEDNNNTGVTTIINNSPADVWKSAEVTYLNDNEIIGVTQRLKVKNKSKVITKVSFKTLLGEHSNMSYEPIRVYIDTNKGIVVGKEYGKLNGDMEF